MSKNKTKAVPSAAAPPPKLSERKEAIAKTGALQKNGDAPAPDTALPSPPAEATKKGPPKNVVDRSKHTYTAHRDVKTAGGRASVDNDDPMAQALRGKDADAVVKLVELNGGEVNPTWDHLNPGLRRMSAGNVLRKLARRSEGVLIEGVTVKLDPIPEDPERAAARAAKARAAEEAKAAKASAKAAAKVPAEVQAKAA